MSKTIYNEHRYTEGYIDPTAGQAIENIEREARKQQKHKKLSKRREGKKHGHKQQK